MHSAVEGLSRISKSQDMKLVKDIEDIYFTNGKGNPVLDIKIEGVLKEDQEKEQIVRKSVNEPSGKKTSKTGSKLISSSINPIDNIKKVARRLN